ncbi:MAG: hypothetical protein HY217_04520 [Candidatus Rokubacteria bacterium]|nr:hypothetical protein [Candidatus Rokubacteria bacterium]
MLPVPAWIDAVFVALVAVLGGLLLLGQRYGLTELEVPARARRRRLLVAGAGLVVPVAYFLRILSLRQVRAGHREPPSPVFHEDTVRQERLEVNRGPVRSR